MDCLLEVYHEVAAMAKRLIFEIPEADPHNIPMTRLLEYLTEVATLLGHRKHVHFLKVEDGSLPCFMEIDEEVETDVLARLLNEET